MKRSHAALGGLLALSVAATVWLAAQPEDDEVVVLPGRRTVPPPPRGQPAVAPLEPVAAGRPRSATDWGSLGAPAALAWGIAPPPAQVEAAPPPPPAAPPLPYTLIGRVDEGGMARAYLVGPRRTLAVKAGDALEGPWRVVAVDDDGVEILWTAGDQRQRLNYSQP